MVKKASVSWAKKAEPNEIKKWIEQLGDNEYCKRDEATRRLKEIGENALESLKKTAQETGDPEVKLRAQSIIKSLEELVKIRQEIIRGDPVTSLWQAFTDPNPGEDQTLAIETLTKTLQSLNKKSLVSKYLDELIKILPAEYTPIEQTELLNTAIKSVVELIKLNLRDAKRITAAKQALEKIYNARDGNGASWMFPQSIRQACDKALKDIEAAKALRKIVEIILWISPYIEDFFKELEGLLEDALSISLEASSIEDIPERYPRAIYNGEDPTLLFEEGKWVSEWADELIVPLDDLIPLEVLDELTPVALEVGQWQGQLYMVPQSMEVVALYYNKRHFDEAGMSYPDDGSTLYGLLSATSQVGAFGFYPDFWFLGGYLHAFGGEIASSNGCELDQVSTTIFLELIIDVTKSSGVVTDTYEELHNQFKEGNLAMIINGPWAIREYREALGEDSIGVIPLPPVDDNSLRPRPYLNILGYMISPNTSLEEKGTAAELIGFMTGPETQSLLLTRKGMLPTNVEVDTSFDPVLEVFVNEAASAMPPPDVPQLEMIWSIGTEMIASTLEGYATSEEIIEKACDEIDKIIRNSN